MNQALYRKYRSRSFDEVVGQEHVTKTLQKAIKAGRISHAYLFTGPRGVGKTSVARILAREVNQLPYEGEAMHLDIIEIDAASNRRIDEIRDLREKVRIAPAVGKYKIYIIDEVHMLTKEAFNALLKTLEEPPAHSIFVLATTDAHKLPETIISRVQRFEFKSIAPAQIAAHLGSIAKKEKISIEPTALDLLAQLGKGSFRDSIGYLDQLSAAGDKITQTVVRAVLGLPPVETIRQILDSINKQDAQRLLVTLIELKEHGVDPSAIASAIAAVLRQSVISGRAKSVDTKLLRQLVEVPASSQPYDFLEISLLDAAETANQTVSSAKLTSASGHKTPAKARQITEPAEKPDQARSDPVGSIAMRPFDQSIWEDIIKTVKQQAASLYTALRLAEPQFEDELLILKFHFPLHQKKLSQAKNKLLLADIIKKLSGKHVTIDCLVDKTALVPEAVDRAAKEFHQSTPLQSINSIFGPAELLES